MAQTRAPAQKKLPLVLDACCGPRMMWFDRSDPRTLFIDKRQESHQVTSHPGQMVVIAPDAVANFMSLPFPDETFHMVVFDPPHMSKSKASNGKFAKIYGALDQDWPQQLRKGFSECFRVLKPHGTLIFKWADISIPVSQVLMTTPARPLFGHRGGKHTHWIVFMKE
jgi:SAM-dependent methyltransferase